MDLPDVTLPAAVTNLLPTLLSEGGTITWTAPGDNGSPVAGYEVRYAKVPITAANFDDNAVTTAVTYTGAPPNPGQPDGIDVAPLYIENDYYFALRRFCSLALPRRLIAGTRLGGLRLPRLPLFAGGQRNVVLVGGGEVGLQPVIILLRNGLQLVVVAAGVLQSQVVHALQARKIRQNHQQGLEGSSVQKHQALQHKLLLRILRGGECDSLSISPYWAGGGRTLQNCQIHTSTAARLDTIISEPH
jgi:hypothetical protein